MVVVFSYHVFNLLVDDKKVAYVKNSGKMSFLFFTKKQVLFFLLNLMYIWTYAQNIYYIYIYNCDRITSI